MRSDVIIIGRGIIGLTIGFRLLNKGYKVTIIDHNPYHKAASWGNAGLISPTFSALSPSIGKLKDMIKWVFSKESGIKVSVSSLISNAGWVYSFLRRSKKAKHPEIIKLVYEMCLEGYKWYEEISTKIDIDFRKSGLIEVYLDEKKLERKLEDVKNIAIGKYEVMSSERVLEEEPSLNKNIKGAIFYPEEACLNPRKLVLNMINLLKEMGAKFLEEKALAIKTESSSVKEVVASNHRLSGDVYIIATGAYKDIYKSLGIKIPLIGGRGYSLIFHSNLLLNRYVMGGDHRVSIFNLTPNQIKTSGFLEIADVEDKPSYDCFDLLKRFAKEYLPGLNCDTVLEEWVGSRPCTPDMLPIIDKIMNNLFLCVGHCRIGVNLAPYSSRLILDMIEEGKEAPEHFKLSRFL